MYRGESIKSSVDRRKNNESKSDFPSQFHAGRWCGWCRCTDCLRRFQQLRKHRIPAPARIIRDNRLIVNAISDTVRSLRRIGVSATSRVEDHDDYFDVIVTVRAPQAAAERA